MSSDSSAMSWNHSAGAVVATRAGTGRAADLTDASRVHPAQHRAVEYAFRNVEP